MGGVGLGEMVGWGWGRGRWWVIPPLPQNGKGQRGGGSTVGRVENEIKVEKSRFDNRENEGRRSSE